MAAKTLHTKFGTAKVDKRGYYAITSHKEGNHTKSLHRLIFEDFYQMIIPQGYHIHHKNGNRLDNCILNLQMLKAREHLSLHTKGKNNPMYGKHDERCPMYGKFGKDHPAYYNTVSKERMLEYSKSKNRTGFFRVYKQKNKCYVQGFSWVYRYFENHKRISIYAVQLEDLKEKVIARGLDWIVIDEDKAQASMME